MNTNYPALVVALYNRVIPSQRLLNSLAEAIYPQGEIPLVISIDNDFNRNKDVLELANQFDWKHGSKEVIYHENNLGLRDHFNYCGDLTERFGAIIFLEDDLFVSPYFYDYTLQALDFYLEDERVAGISLFNYTRIEKKFNPWPFSAIDDGYDNYFLQHASWGQVWTQKIWKPYKEWYKVYGKPEYINSLELVPPMIRSWQDSSWKKNYISHMILHGKYYVFPRVALATNFDDVGTHRRSNTVHYQSPLLVQKKQFRFSRFTESMSIYDPFFEILPDILKKFNPDLSGYDFQVNLYGDKDLKSIKSKSVLSKIPGRMNLKSYNLTMKPHELNIIFKVPGDKIFLCDVDQLTETDPRKTAIENFIYFYRSMFKLEEVRDILSYKMRNRWKKMTGLVEN